MVATTLINSRLPVSTEGLKANTSAGIQLSAKPKVGDSFSSLVTTYYPSKRNEKDAHIEGGERDNAGLPLTQVEHGADQIIKRAVASGRSLRESPPVLYVAADQRFYGYGSVLNFSGPQVRNLFLRSGARVEDAEYFASVGVRVVVRDIGSAIKGAQRFDLCTSRALENVTFGGVTVKIELLASPGKPKRPDTPRAALDRAIAFAGARPKLSPPPSIAEAIIPSNVAPRPPTASQNSADRGSLGKDYHRWLSERNSAPLTVPEGFKLDANGKIVWPSLYGLNTSSSEAPVEDFGRVNALASDEEVKRVRRQGEPLLAARAGYAERMRNAQRELDAQRSSRESYPAPSTVVSPDSLSADEKRLSNDTGLQLIGLNSVTKPVLNPAVVYGAAPNLHFNPESGNRVSFGSSLGPYWAQKEQAGKDFAAHGQYSEQNRAQFEATIVRLEDEANHEEQLLKTELSTRLARGEKLITTERAVYQAKKSDATFLKAFVNYYKAIQNSSLPEEVKQGYLKALSNIMMAWISGEKYKPVDVPNVKDGISGVSTLTLPYMLNAILQGNESSSRELRRNGGDGGMLHVYLRLNGGSELSKVVQTRRGFFASAPYFRTQEQINSGVGLPSDLITSRPGKPLRLSPPTEVRLEDARARSQETLRNNLRDFFKANPEAWVRAQSDTAFMAYLDRLMFARNPDGSPAENQHRLVSVQYVEKARALENDENSRQRIPRDFSGDSNLLSYQRNRQDIENPFRARTP